jgi:hypothetical protein
LTDVVLDKLWEGNHVMRIAERSGRSRIG